MKTSPSASAGLRSTLRSASVVRNRTWTGSPVPSPQVNFAPLAVVNVIEPRRMNCWRKYRNKRSIETTKSDPAKANVPAVTLDAHGTEMVPAHHEEIIGAPVPSRYCVVHKADIRKPRAHAVASYVRFHSRDNRLKGDRAGRCRIKGAGSEFPHLENRNVEPSAQVSDGDASDRLFRGDPGPGAKSRGRQEPIPDFRGHLCGLPQGPTGPLEERAG